MDELLLVSEKLDSKERELVDLRRAQHQPNTPSGASFEEAPRIAGGGAKPARTVWDMPAGQDSADLVPKASDSLVQQYLRRTTIHDVHETAATVPLRDMRTWAASDGGASLGSWPIDLWGSSGTADDQKNRFRTGASRHALPARGSSRGGMRKAHLSQDRSEASESVLHDENTSTIPPVTHNNNAGSAATSRPMPRHHKPILDTAAVAPSKGSSTLAMERAPSPLPREICVDTDAADTSPWHRTVSPWHRTATATMADAILGRPQINSNSDAMDHHRGINYSDTSPGGSWDDEASAESGDRPTATPAGRRWEDLFHSSSGGSSLEGSWQSMDSVGHHHRSPSDNATPSPLTGPPRERPHRPAPAAAAYATASDGGDSVATRLRRGSASRDPQDGLSSDARATSRLLRPSFRSQTDGGGSYLAESYTRFSPSSYARQARGHLRSQTDGVESSPEGWPVDFCAILDSAGVAGKASRQGEGRRGAGQHVEDADSDESDDASLGPGSSKLFRSIQDQVAALRAALGGGDFDSTSQSYEQDGAPAQDSGRRTVGRSTVTENRDPLHGMESGRGSKTVRRRPQRHHAAGVRLLNPQHAAAAFVVVMGEGTDPREAPL